MPSVAVPKLLKDPGYLFWGPLLTAEPSNTATASKFDDTWPVAWIPLGATEAGSTFSYSISVEAVSVAEFFDPIQWATTERNGNIAFNLADYTLDNLSRAMNGGSLTVVSGTGATEVSKFEPPDPGQEVRCMIGWESLDNTMRIICRQTINAAEISSAFQKAPAISVIPCQFNFEVPTTGEKPFAVYGTSARVAA